MFIVGTDVPDGTEVQTDLCIVGAGAAGIALAREFAGSRSDICLLESGGLEADRATHELSRGELAGHPYYPLEATRLRYFGGTTNHWAGGSRPLETFDFEVRDWVPHSGWPFDRAHLDPYYARAHATCGLGRYEYEREPWEARLGPPFPFRGTEVTTVVMRRLPYRFGVRYRDLIAESTNIRCYLDSNLTRISLHPDGRTVDHLEVRTLAGTGFRVRPRVCVLAMGAIENARLLLHSDDVHSTGVGNGYDLVGRYFMEHPKTVAAVALLSDPATSIGLYLGGPSNEAKAERIEGFLTFSPEFLVRERMLNVRAFVQPGAVSGREFAGGITHLGGTSDRSMVEQLARAVGDIDDVSDYLYRRLFRPSHRVSGLRLMTMVEPVPNPDSRVELTREIDAVGIPRVRLTWRFGDDELRTIRKANERFATAFGEASLGRVKMQPEETEGSSATIRGDWHQMGTTRMHDDPSRGVVNANCRVHGVENLFVASSSVFPTVGYTNPTLTIVALTLRLADHLRATVL